MLAQGALRRRGRPRALAVAGAMAGGLTLGYATTTRAALPLVGALAVAVLVLLVARHPARALLAFFVLAPLNGLIYQGLTNRLGLNLGPLAYWKEGLLVALLLRGAYDRMREPDGGLPRSRAQRYLVFYVLALCVLAAVSPDQLAAGFALPRGVDGPLMLLAVVALRPSRRTVMLCLAGMLASVVVISVAALVEQNVRAALPEWMGAGNPPLTSAYYAGSGYRSGSFVGSPLVLGFYAGAAAALAAALAAVCRGRARAAVILVFLLAVAALVVTYTRSAYLGGGIGVITALGLAVRNPRIRLSLVGLVVVGAASAAAIAFVAGNEMLTHGAEDNQAHADAISQDLDIISSNPLGYGLGSIDSVGQRFHPDGPRLSSENLYLAKGVEGGAAGLVLFPVALFALGMSLRAVRGRALRRGDVFVAALSAGAIGALLAVAVSGLFLGVEEVPYLTIVWGAAGFASTLDGQARTAEEARDTGTVALAAAG